MDENIFEMLTENAAAIAPCNHNHALVQNPFAWEVESEENEAEEIEAE
jgi:hypothetical protein